MFTIATAADAGAPTEVDEAKWAAVMKEARRYNLDLPVKVSD